MRKKFSRMRGTHTHGGGAKKKRRGFGNKGGRGNAGSGKRADSKKPSIWGSGKRWGKYGFISHRKQEKGCNILDLEKKSLQEEKGVFIVDKSVCDKVLGKGIPTRKYRLLVPCSKTAAEKVKKAGGSVELEESSEQSA